MKSKTSLVNGTILKKDILRFWPLWVIELIYSLIVGPLMTGLPIASYELSRQQDMYYASLDAAEYKTIIQRCFAVYMDDWAIVIHIAVVSIIAAVLVFGYLNSRKQSYMIHSMPVSRQTLFVSHYLAGFLMALLPILAADLILGAVSLAFGAGMGMAILGYGIQTVLMMIFFYTLACLVVMLSGHGFMSIVIYSVLNGIVVAVWSLLEFIGSFFQMGGSDVSALSGWKRIWTPVLFFESKLGNDFTDQWTQFNCEGIGMMCLYLIPAVLFFALAMFLYRRRPLERVGENLAFSWSIPVFKIVFTVAASLSAMMIWYGLFSELVEKICGKYMREAALYITLVILCLVFYFVGEMIVRKTFMIWKKISWLQACIVTVVLALSVLAFRVCYDKQSVPDAARVDQISVNVYSNTFMFDDQEIIEALNEIHTNMRSELDPDEGQYYDDSYYIGFSYTLDSGSSIHRNYYVSETRNPDIFRQLNDLLGQKEVLLKGWNLDKPEEIEPVYIYINDYRSEGVDYRSYYIDNKTDEKSCEKVLEALLLDIEENHISYEDALQRRMSENNLCTLEICIQSSSYDHETMSDHNYVYFPVDESCVHTMEVLEKIIAEQEKEIW